MDEIYRSSEKIDQISKAIHAVQTDDQIQSMYTTQEADMLKYKVKYIDFNALKLKLQKAMDEQGLMIEFSQGKGTQLITFIYHIPSGQWKLYVCTSVANKQKGEHTMQTVGAAISYLKRRQLIHIFNIAIVDDDDEGRKIEVENEIAKERALKEFTTKIRATKTGEEVNKIYTEYKWLKGVKAFDEEIANKQKQLKNK